MESWSSLVKKALLVKAIPVASDLDTVVPVLVVIDALDEIDIRRL
jgi:hypothetical protein